MPDLPSFLSSLVFDPPVAYSAIGAVVMGLGLAVAAWTTRRRPVSVWLWTLGVLGVAAGVTALISSVVMVAPREVTVYAAPLVGLIAALVALPTAGILFSESRRPNFELRHAVGRRAQVYQAIPAAGAGVGRVRVHAAGRSVLLSAVSAGPDFPRYAFVRVQSGTSDGRVQVQADDGDA